MVARGAPQEFQLLLGEVSTLRNSLTILQDEVKNPDSTLVRAGENRMRMVNGMIAGITDTLKRLEKLAGKYEILGSNSRRKQLWAKLKWSTEFSGIDALRNKVSAACYIFLLIQSAAYCVSAYLPQCGHEFALDLCWQVCTMLAMFILVCVNQPLALLFSVSSHLTQPWRKMLKQSKAML